MVNKAAVLGHPIHHSLSPRMHGYWLKELCIAGSYEAIDTPPEKLESTLNYLQQQGYKGVNLTVPLKELALSFLDEIDPIAEQIGAVNTIIFSKNKKKGYNTDAYGFIQNLRTHPFPLNIERSIILGAGGAARAVIAGLLKAGAKEIVICNRNLARAEELIKPSPLEGEGWVRGRAYHPLHVKYAKQLRHDQTDVEKELWYHLRNRQIAGAKFRRQQPIGQYIVDFVCQEAKLIIELDGSQHMNAASDQKRDEYMQGEGYRVLRFWNNEVLQNREGVCEAIYETLTSTPHPTLSPKGRGLSVADWNDRHQILKTATLLVNTTSLGMVGQPPLEIALDALPVNALVTDIVYHPLQTPLLALAKSRGNPIVEGLGMLLYQGQKAFELFFRETPEVTEELKHQLMML